MYYTSIDAEEDYTVEGLLSERFLWNECCTFEISCVTTRKEVLSICLVGLWGKEEERKIVFSHNTGTCCRGNSEASQQTRQASFSQPAQGKSWHRLSVKLCLAMWFLPLIQRYLTRLNPFHLESMLSMLRCRVSANLTVLWERERDVKKKRENEDSEGLLYLW